MQQTAINPALAAAMTLESAAQMGEFRPTTPDGQPTVAAQLMQRAMPPSVPQVAQQAGIAGQIQAMRMKQAQEALMNQAMAQRPQGGVEALNPQVGNFAEGGIVGYSGKDESDVKDKEERKYRSFQSLPIYEPTTYGNVDKFLMNLFRSPGQVRIDPVTNEPISFGEFMRRQESEAAQLAAPAAAAVAAAQFPGRTAPGATAQDLASISAPLRGAPPARVNQSSGIGSLPAAEMGPPVPTGSDRQFGQALAAHERSRPRDVTPEQGYEAAMQANAQQRRFLQAMGVDPDMLKKQAEEVERRGTERGSYYESQAQAARDKAKRDSLKNFLLGASGRGFGDVMASSERAASGADAAAEAQAQRFMELKLQTQDAAVKERMLINRLQFETATGQFDKAMKTKQEIENNRQKFERSEAELRMGRAKDLAAEERQRLDREMEARRIAATERGQNLQFLSSMQRTGGATNPRAIYDTINDNVQKRMDAWTKSREGIISGKDPSVAANKRREFVAEAIREAQALGVAIPPEVTKAFEQGTTGGSTGATNVDLSKFKVTKE